MPSPTACSAACRRSPQRSSARRRRVRAAGPSPALLPLAAAVEAPWRLPRGDAPRAGRAALRSGSELSMNCALYGSGHGRWWRLGTVHVNPPTSDNFVAPRYSSNAPSRRHGDLCHRRARGLRARACRAHLACFGKPCFPVRNAPTSCCCRFPIRRGMLSACGSEKRRHSAASARRFGRGTRDLPWRHAPRVGASNCNQRPRIGRIARGSLC